MAGDGSHLCLMATRNEGTVRADYWLQYSKVGYECANVGQTLSGRFALVLPGKTTANGGELGGGRIAVDGH